MRSPTLKSSLNSVVSWLSKGLSRSLNPLVQSFDKKPV